MSVPDTTTTKLHTTTVISHGTVLAPFLFALYTADCRSTNESCPLVKFADDTELVWKICNDEDASSVSSAKFTRGNFYHTNLQSFQSACVYFKQTENFVNWCDKNYLYLNVSKTTRKRCALIFRKHQRCPKPVYVKGETVERVGTYKYLGVVFDSKLNWKENINSVLKKSELENVLHEKAEIIWSKFRYASNFFL